MLATQILAFALVAAGLWFAWDSLRAREKANDAMRAACEARGLLFLDDTVALRNLRVARDDEGRLALRRTFDFAYSGTGFDRRAGMLLMLGTEVLVVELDPPFAA